MKTFKFDYPWSERKEWFLPDDEEMMKGQFPILDEQIDCVLGAIEEANGWDVGNPGHLRTCIQAGGAFGVYPRRLADYFKKVITFEPLLENLQCMAANLGDHPDIEVWHAALWHERTMLQMMYSKPVKNSYGAHHVTARGRGIGGMVETWVMDDSVYDDLDLIWLDVEGSEFYALAGARETIREHSPVVVIEEAKTLAAHKEIGIRPTAASDWLRNIGYKEYGRTHGDLIFIPQ